MAKIKILTTAEQIIFNDPSKLSPDEQSKYFRLPLELTVWLESVSNLTNKV